MNDNKLYAVICVCACVFLTAFVIYGSACTVKERELDQAPKLYCVEHGGYWESSTGSCIYFQHLRGEGR